MIVCSPSLIRNVNAARRWSADKRRHHDDVDRFEAPVPVLERDFVAVGGNPRLVIRRARQRCDEWPELILGNTRGALERHVADEGERPFDDGNHRLDEPLPRPGRIELVGVRVDLRLRVAKTLMTPRDRTDCGGQVGFHEDIVRLELHQRWPQLLVGTERLPAISAPWLTRSGHLRMVNTIAGVPSPSSRAALASAFQ